VSALEQALVDYLGLRRALGHELAEAGRLLPGFVAYLDERHAPTVTIELALAWAQGQRSSDGPLSTAGPLSTVGPRRMTAVRGFARFLAGRDPGTQIPPLGLMPHRQRWRPPFIYSTTDIDAILAQARVSIVSPQRAATYTTLIAMLAATGLRIGEAIKLDRSDVDWTGGVLLIRESKFGKSRLVPLHPTGMAALTDYTAARDRDLAQPESPAVFLSLRGKRLLYAVVQQTFRRLVTEARVGTKAPCPPRLHDLRHTFAVGTLLRWYRDGGNVQARIPALSTYLGHRTPSSTYWYLSAAPELLALAADRLDAFPARSRA
jgi:integrase/recombinase XerD